VERMDDEAAATGPTQRYNPAALVGFALSAVSISCSPFFFVAILIENAGNESNAVVDALMVASFALLYPALVVLWIGRQRAKQRGAPHGRLALAGLWLLVISALILGLGACRAVADFREHQSEPKPGSY